MDKETLQKKILAFVQKHSNAFRELSEEERKERKHEVHCGFRHGLSEDEVAAYVKREFTTLHMQAIRVSLEEGIPLDIVVGRIAKEGLSVEEMIQEKIAYYTGLESRGDEVPEVYTKAIDMELNKLATRIDTQQRFFQDTLEALKTDKNELVKELQQLRNQKQELEQKLEKKLVGGCSVERVVKDNGYLKLPPRSVMFQEEKPKKKLFKRKDAVSKDTLLSQLSNPEFSVEQIKILMLAHNSGLDQKTFSMVANPKLEEEKMLLLVEMLMPGIMRGGGITMSKGGEPHCHLVSDNSSDG